MEIDCAEIRLRAERPLGEVILLQKETVGMAKGGGDTSTGSRMVLVQEPPTLADVGISKKLSSMSQKLAGRGGGGRGFAQAFQYVFINPHKIFVS